MVSPRARILFCTWQYHPESAGGAEKQARLQAEELTRRGYGVDVVCPRAPGQTSGLVDGVRVHRLIRIQRWRLQRLSYFTSLMAFLLIRGRRYAIIHVHLANLQADAVVFAARLIRRPVHVKLASGGAQGEVARLKQVARITRWYGLRHADSVQALSDEIALSLRGIGVPDARIRRIPNGVPIPAISRMSKGEVRTLRLNLGLPPDKQLVLFIGRFATYKGIDDLLAAWGSGLGEDNHLVLVGTEAIDRPAGPLATGPNVSVYGWTSEVTAYLRACDIFVLPSHSEGMSNALLEAMAAGSAILATSVGAATEMLNDECAVLVPPKEPEQLRNALLELLDNPPRRVALGRKAHVRAQDFSIQAVVSRLEDAYAAVAPALRS